jgi:hypothetical protein
MVLEIPPAEGGSITGSVDDCWKMAIEDVGPAGVDKGRGGEYLTPFTRLQRSGSGSFIPLPSETYQGYSLLRSNLQSSIEADVASAVAYGRRVKFYPLSENGNPHYDPICRRRRRNLRRIYSQKISGLIWEPACLNQSRLNVQNTKGEIPLPIRIVGRTLAWWSRSIYKPWRVDPCDQESECFRADAPRAPLSRKTWPRY